MGAGGSIRPAPRENELAVRNHVSCLSRPIYTLWAVAERQQKPDLRHYHPLPEGYAALQGRDREQVGPLRQHGAHSMPQQLGIVLGVGIGKEQDLTPAASVRKISFWA